MSHRGRNDGDVKEEEGDTVRPRRIMFGYGALVASIITARMQYSGKICPMILGVKCMLPMPTIS